MTRTPSLTNPSIRTTPPGTCFAAPLHTTYSNFSNEFWISYISNGHTKLLRAFSFSFSSWSFFLNLGFFVGGLGLHVLFRYHLPPILVKSVWRFVLKSLRLEVCFSVGFFLNISFVFYLYEQQLHNPPPRGIDPSLYEVNINTKRKERIYGKMIRQGYSIAKVCLSVDW